MLNYKFIVLVIVFFVCIETVQAQNSNYTVSSVAGTSICLKRGEEKYVLKVKINAPASACTITKYKIIWDDGKEDSFPFDPSKTEHEHEYDFKDFVNSCTERVRRNVEIETDNKNCESNITPVNFFNAPKPDFTTNRQFPCAGQSVSFYPESCPSTSNTSLIWSYGDGSADDDKGSHTFAKSGTYDVKLTVKNDCGTGTITRKITIIDQAKAAMSDSGHVKIVADTAIICLNGGGVIRLDGTVSQSATDYEWRFSDNGAIVFLDNTNRYSPKPKIKFTKPGIYNIELTVNNDCGIPSKISCFHKVEDVPVPRLTKHGDKCEPTKYKISNYTSFVSGAVYKLNGKIITIDEETTLPFSDTPYIVEASINNICGNTPITDTFFVRAPQQVKITNKFRDTVLCVGSGVLPLSINITGGNWTGNGLIDQGTSKAFDPQNSGVYQIVYSYGTGACASSDNVKIEVKGVDITTKDEAICQGQDKLPLIATPLGGVWTTTGCTNCIDKDTLSIASITASQIKLTYTVNSDVGGGKFCDASKQITVSIGSPKANFDIQGGCSGTNAQITNMSSGGTGYEWYLNGAATPISTATNPSFALPSGSVDVKLIVKAGGCEDTASKTINITSKPDAISFTSNITSGCSPLSVTLTPNGSERNDVTYTWDFGDGTTSNGFQPPLHVFSNSGSTIKEFEIKLLAQNNCGNEGDNQKISVNPLAKAEIGVDSTVFRCTPAAVKFSNRSVGHQGNSLWIFGDGQTSNNSSDTLSHVFSAKDSAQVYKVQLVVSNSCGNDTNNVELTVYPSTVKALFLMDKTSACIGEPVSFKDASVPKPSRWEWKFGTETEAFSANPVYGFKQSQTYTITMIAHTDCGSGSIQRNIKIVPPPSVDFEINAPVVCEGETVEMEIKADSIYSFHWNFGDGSPIDSINATTSHVFAGDGTKKITLTGFGSSAACKNEKQKEVYINPRPKADFAVKNAVDTLCSGVPITFENKSLDATVFRWYANDTLYASQHLEVSLKTGIHDIALVAINNEGCRDSVYRHGVISVDTCQVMFPDAFTPNNDGNGDYFTAYATKGIRKVNYLRIRNRWGEIIYMAKDINPNIPSEGWNGISSKGNSVPNGEYIYEAEIELAGGGKRSFVNKVMVIR